MSFNEHDPGEEARKFAVVFFILVVAIYAFALGMLQLGARSARHHPVHQEEVR